MKVQWFKYGILGLGVSFCLMLATTAHAQTLKFDSVFTVSSTSGSNSGLWTVPSGKAWKIVGGGGNTGATNAWFYINGTAAGKWSFHGKGGGNADLRWSSLDLPFWLGPGDTFGIRGSSGQFRWLSVIQFDIN